MRYYYYCFGTFFPWKQVPVGIHYNHLESNWTTAAVHHEGASYKHFRAPCQGFWYLDTDSWWSIPTGWAILSQQQSGLGAEVRSENISTAVTELILVDPRVRFRELWWSDPEKSWKMMEHVRLQHAGTHSHTLLHTALPLPAFRALFSVPWCWEQRGSFLVFSVSVFDKLQLFSLSSSGHKSVKWLGLHQQNSLLMLIHQCYAARHTPKRLPSVTVFSQQQGSFGCQSIIIITLRLG